MTKEQELQRQKVRDHIRTILLMTFTKLTDQRNSTSEWLDKGTDAIINFPSIAVVDSDQSLPENNENDIMNTSPRRVCSDSYKSMLKAGFVKVIQFHCDIQTK